MSRHSIRPQAPRRSFNLPGPVASLALAITALLAQGCTLNRGGEDARPPVQAGPDPAAVAAHDAAVALLQSGDEQQAAVQFAALAERHPDYAGPLVNRAIIHARHGETDQALALLERAVTVCANCAAAWNQRGILLRQQGRFIEAEESYLKAIAADPGYADAHFNLGILYDLYLQRPQLALGQYERFVALQADAAIAAGVDKWIADLRRRTATIEQAAQAMEQP